MENISYILSCMFFTKGHTQRNYTSMHIHYRINYNILCQSFICLGYIIDKMSSNGIYFPLALTIYNLRIFLYTLNKW